MTEIDNIFIQVRSRLHEKSIKLWEEPYYFEGIGCIESELERLSTEFSLELGISASKCKCALTELQDGALRKLAARKEFQETGRATFNVRSIASGEGTVNIIEVKCSLTDLGADLQAQVAEKLNLSSSTQVKCISAGKIIASNKTLESQGLKNNQHLMVIVGNGEDAKKSEELYERIRKIKADVETIVNSDQQLMEMEDQDGNLVFLPPEENRALLMGLGYCEKARAAIKRKKYDEALLLLLEADAHFNGCNSKFLESVDNYALLNLDIVWCYLALKNLNQLPDADRRLSICERNFRRSYGENFERLITLKGTACPERALIMRLHLLQGVILFHQNQRDEAYIRLQLAASELQELKVNDAELITLVEMGYEPADARLGLRACGGNVPEAIQFIHERREKLRLARDKSEKERKLQRDLKLNTKSQEEWVNPRSVTTLIEMGFELELVVEALQRTQNDVNAALNLIETNGEELRANLPPAQNADDEILSQLQELGFDEAIARLALQTSHNNIDKAIDFLIRLFGDENELMATIERMSTHMVASPEGMASTSSGIRSSSGPLATKLMEKAKREMESYKAYKRFNKDLTDNDQDYLDLTLEHEEQILTEYKCLLEK